MTYGLKRSIEQIDWYMETLPTISASYEIESADWKDAQDQTQKLYRQILEYQMRSVCNCYREHPVVGSVGTDLENYHWETQIEAIVDLEMSIDQKMVHGTRTEYLGDDLQCAPPIQEYLQWYRERESAGLEADARNKSASPNKEEQRRRLLPQVISRADHSYHRDPEFEAWRRGQTPLLLLSVEPDCLKPALARHLAERLRSEFSESKTSFVLFNSDNDTQDRKDQLPAALYAIIRKVFAKDVLLTGNLKADATKLWAHSTETREQPQVFCILDALDEFDLDSLQYFAHILNICTARSGPRRIKLLAIIQRHQDIFDRFRSFRPHYTHISWPMTMQLQTGIETIVNERLKALNAQGDYNTIRKTLKLEGCDQTSCLWAELVLDALLELSGSKFEAKRWRELTETPPRDNFALFRKLIEPAPTSKPQASAPPPLMRRPPSYSSAKELLHDHLWSFLGVKAEPQSM